MPSGEQHVIWGPVRNKKMIDTATGKAMLTFSVPVSHGKQKNDPTKDISTWYNVKAMEHDARVLDARLSDGDHVVIRHDALKANAYTNKDGEVRSGLELWVKDFHVGILLWTPKPKDDAEKPESPVTPEPVYQTPAEDEDSGCPF